MQPKNPIRIKCSGGAAAQTLALINALYVTEGVSRGFQFEYYPFGTGTYWPFEIANLLTTEELGDISKLSRGHLLENNQQGVGEIVDSHPINSKKLSLERLYSLIRKCKVDRLLLSFRGELPINGSRERLDRVNSSTQIISGGFVPVSDKRILKLLDERFISGGLESPFSKIANGDFDVVIHYRIGDKRAKFTNPGVVGDDGVLDPQVMSDLLNELGLANSKIMVVSDEPDVAQKLLESAGIAAEIQETGSSIWEDLRAIAATKVFIGSWSQVSQLASICVTNNGGLAYLPSDFKGKNSLKWRISGVNFYAPKFLGSDHEIYFK